MLNWIERITCFLICVPHKHCKKQCQFHQMREKCWSIAQQWSIIKPQSTLENQQPFFPRSAVRLSNVRVCNVNMCYHLDNIREQKKRIFADSWQLLLMLVCMFVFVCAASRRCNIIENTRHTSYTQTQAWPRTRRADVQFIYFIQYYTCVDLTISRASLSLINKIIWSILIDSTITICSYEHRNQLFAFQWNANSLKLK